MTFTNSKAYTHLDYVPCQNANPNRWKTDYDKLEYKHGYIQWL